MRVKFQSSFSIVFFKFKVHLNYHPYNAFKGLIQIQYQSVTNTVKRMKIKLTDVSSFIRKHDMQHQLPPKSIINELMFKKKGVFIMKKKNITLICALAMALTACGQSSQTSTNKAESTTVAEASTT